MRWPWQRAVDAEKAHEKKAEQEQIDDRDAREARQRQARVRSEMEALRAEARLPRLRG